VRFCVAAVHRHQAEGWSVAEFHSKLSTATSSITANVDAVAVCTRAHAFSAGPTYFYAPSVFCRAVPFSVTITGPLSGRRPRKNRWRIVASSAFGQIRTPSSWSDTVFRAKRAVALMPIARVGLEPYKVVARAGAEKVPWHSALMRSRRASPPGNRLQSPVQSDSTEFAAPRSQRGWPQAGCASSIPRRALHLDRTFR